MRGPHLGGLVAGDLRLASSGLVPCPRAKSQHSQVILTPVLPSAPLFTVALCELPVGTLGWKLRALCNERLMEAHFVFASLGVPCSFSFSCSFSAGVVVRFRFRFRLVPAWSFGFVFVFV